MAGGHDRNRECRRGTPNCSWQRAQGRVATVAVDGMTFYKTVLVGDLVSLYADLVKTGTTSMTIEVEVWVTRQPGNQLFQVTSARFVFVAVDELGVKRALPEID